MKIAKTCLATLALSLPTNSWSQGLVPTMEREFEFCEERPAEPEWMQNLHVREAQKRLTVQYIYRFQSAERVIEAGECACSTRFPEWETAVQHFNDNYLGGDRNDLREATADFQRRYNELRPQARDICEREGHW
ncbi:hypothetical protein BCF46_3739 [Litoreibacter meonggei]|uniref:Uncharacterized protein n=2 Tax=Rhodobacterales TaxID=204455 RepID=A0A497VEK1_9RHOB|nr:MULTISPECIES: hypothetical protein [Rhodobacterales]MDU9006740.1 hypothetical protein [Sedimentitalea todarodis]RLJ40667.1 hypothetical protein BCF46_3739 [Litoreibacter meonggei]